MLTLALVICIGASVLVARAASHQNHSARFVAAHVNNVLARKCRGHYAFHGGSLELWIRRHRYAHRLKDACPTTPWYVTKQIWAANILGRESAGDPWPNCPDPFNSSSYSWQDTVNCENGGSWLDSPGYYRCGLQFDPMWEQRFGRLCP